MGDVVHAKDLRVRTDEELQSFLRDKNEELFKLRFQHHTGQLENVSRMRQVKREIARAKTLLLEKQRSTES